MNVILRPRWKEAEQAADDLTAEYSTPPIPVLEIAENSGVNVVFVDFGKHSETVSGLCDFKGKRIFVNAKDKSERQSFTIAHELGHWLLHRDIFLENPSRYPVLPRFSAPDESDRLEKEANKFAACLLVPSKLLLPVKGSPVSALARIFRVSRTMMEFRVKNV